MGIVVSSTSTLPRLATSLAAVLVTLGPTAKTDQETYSTGDNIYLDLEYLLALVILPTHPSLHLGLRLMLRMRIIDYTTW